MTARRLATGRVSGWHADGVGERASYLARVRAAGGLPVVLDPHTGDGDGDGDGDQVRAGVDALVARLDGVVLTGGPDLAPARYGESPHETVYGTDDVVDAFELELARTAIGAHLPLLAICRGIQVLNVAYGGTLHQHIPEHPGVAPHGRPGQADGQWVHPVALDPSSRLSAVMGTDTAVCSCHHHQAIDRVGDGLRIVARAADGIIEAVEPLDTSTGFVVAVQWHPEDTAPHDPSQQRLFDALVTAAHATVPL